MEMRAESAFFQLATNTLNWLISNRVITQDVVCGGVRGQIFAWSMPNSDLTVELSYLGSGKFSHVWKARLLIVEELLMT